MIARAGLKIHSFIMKKSRLLTLLLVVLTLPFLGCNRKPQSAESTDKSAPATRNYIVHGYIADVIAMNPVLVNESNIREMCNLVFPRLMIETLDTAVGIISYTPSMATRWEISDANKTITFHLRNDVKWTDGKPVTALDWKFTYQLYMDTAIASVRQNFVTDNFLKDATGNVNLDKAVEIPNDSTLIVKFNKPASEDAMLKYCNLWFLAEHIWRGVDTKTFRSDERNFLPEKIIGCGLYKVEKWERNKELVLIANKSCNLPRPPKIERFILRVIPEYATRLTALKTGEIDVMQGVTPDDADKIRKESDAVVIKEVGYNLFSYIGWINIDNELYNKKKEIKLHPLFGSKKVRQALTHAINRQEIIEGILKGYGKLSAADVTPVCKWAVNTEIVPRPYNPETSKKLLAEDGWKIGNDGVLEKNKRKFKFKLYLNSGNKLRAAYTVIVQKNLKEVGIECELVQIESNDFSKRLANHELEAFAAAFIVSPPDVDPSETRTSDLASTPYNFLGFQNKRVDELITLSKSEMKTLNTAKYWKEYATIIHEEQPETIIAWTTSLVGVGKRVKNVSVSPLGIFDSLIDWEL
jgi:peptide/nickel transport system substrate-binding protein